MGVTTRPYKRGFVTQGPPPETAPNATNSWAASNRQLEGCALPSPGSPGGSPEGRGPAALLGLGPGPGWTSAPGLFRGAQWETGIFPAGLALCSSGAPFSGHFLTSSCIQWL